MVYKGVCATAQGSIHESRHQSCEDASSSVVLLDLNACVLVVADGLGEKDCTRSAIGSRIAVEVARDALIDAAHEKWDLFDVGQLVQSIVVAWREAVNKHASEHPLTDEEHALFDRVRKERGIWHLYASTIVASLITPNGYVLMQQGDGRCLAVDQFGKYHCPIPPDARCLGNRTTSLADTDAAERIRFIRSDENDEHPVAVCVMTDGLSKAFANESDLNAYLDWLTIGIDKYAEDGLQEWLDAQVHHIARNGSGDDTSLAIGFVCPVPRQLVDEAVRRRESYEVRSELERIHLKLVSMKRKRKLLQVRVKSGGESATKEFEEYNERYLSLEQRAEELGKLLAK